MAGQQPSRFEHFGPGVILTAAPAMRQAALRGTGRAGSTSAQVGQYSLSRPPALAEMHPRERAVAKGCGRRLR